MASEDAEKAEYKGAHEANTPPEHVTEYGVGELAGVAHNDEVLQRSLRPRHL